MMVDFRIENRHFLKPWEPARPPEFYTRKYWQRNLEYNIQDFHNDDTVAFSILNPEETEVLGVVNYTSIVRGTFQACHLGYALAQKYQGQGIMSAALELSTAYMFHVRRLHRIMANYMPRNKRSGEVLRRLGFTVDGKARSFMQINGRWEDHVLTSLVNPTD